MAPLTSCAPNFNTILVTAPDIQQFLLLRDLAHDGSYSIAWPNPPLSFAS